MQNSKETEVYKYDYEVVWLPWGESVRAGRSLHEALAQAAACLDSQGRRREGGPEGGRAAARRRQEEILDRLQGQAFEDQKWLAYGSENGEYRNLSHGPYGVSVWRYPRTQA